MGYPSASRAEAEQVAQKRRAFAEQHGFQPDEFILVFVGTFVSSFDLETVIGAAGELQHERCRFVIVGDGDAGPKLRSQAQGLANVIFTGWADALSIRALLGLASAGLAPYRDDASMSLPNKPYEYLSAGLPILSSLRGELQALLADEGVGLTYRAGDTQSLVDAIRLMRQPDLRRRMATNAAALFNARYRSEIVYAQFAAHLEAIAERSR